MIVAGVAGAWRFRAEAGAEDDTSSLLGPDVDGELTRCNEDDTRCFTRGDGRHGEMDADEVVDF